MARKTKAQLDAEAQALREQQEAEAREAYPNLLMDALERATRLGFQIVVRDQKFVVIDRNSPKDAWGLTYSYTPDADSDLDMLRWVLEQREAAEAEANRKWLARQVALAKLSEEERDLLGL